MENASQPIQSLEQLPPPSQAYVLAAEQRSLNFLNPKLWAAMKVVAETFMQAGALPATIKNAQQLLMVLQAGYEAGLQPLEAIKSFYFVNGGLALYGEMAITMVIRAGHKIEWGKCDATTATVRIMRKDNGMSMENTFTMAEANARGLSNKDPWKKFPENMLKFKAFHMTAKFVCPDAFHGVSEIGELEDEREAVRAEIITTAQATPTVETKPVTTHKPLSEALQDKPAEEPQEDKKPKSKKKTEEVAEEPKAEEKPVPEAPKDESEADYIQRLVDEEIGGRKLTPREVMEINAYKAKTQTQNG